MRRAADWQRINPLSGLGRDARLLFWGFFLWDLGFGLYSYLLTLYMEDLGAGAFQIGLLIGLQGLIRIAVYVPGGILADRYSRRKIIVFTTAITIPAVLTLGVAQTWLQLLPGLALLVVGNLGVPSLSSYIAEAGEANRARAFAMIYTVGPSASLIISPAVGGWIGEQTSLRVPFFGSAIAYAAATFLMFRLSERPLAHHGPAARPSYRAAFALPIVRVIGAWQFAVLLSLAIGTTLLPNYLKDAYGLGVGTVGRLGSVAAIGSVLLSLAVGRSAWLTAPRAIALSTLAVGLLCGVTLATGNIALLAVAFLGRGGFMVAWSLFAAVLSDTTPRWLQNRAFAIAEFLGSIGFAIAPFVAGGLYDWRRGAPLVATVATAPFLAGAALWIERRYVRPAANAQSTGAVTSPALAGGIEG